MTTKTLPDDVIHHILGEPLAEAIREAGLCLWRHPAHPRALWLGAILPDGRAAGVDAMDYWGRALIVDGETSAVRALNDVPAWAAETVSAARRILGV